MQVLATKDVLMLKLLLEYYMRSPSAVAATILASVGDAQAEVRRGLCCAATGPVHVYAIGQGNSFRQELRQPF